MFMDVVVPLLIFVGILLALMVAANVSAADDEYKAKRFLADQYDEEQRARER